MKKRCFAFVGVTGSGKSTLVKALGEATKLPTISSGQVARKLAEDDFFIANKLSAGEWAPEDALRQGVYDAIFTASKAESFFMEGFPATMTQFILLETWAKELGFEVEYVLMDVPVGLCIQRLIDRGRKDDNPEAIARKLERWRLFTDEMLGAIGTMVSLPAWEVQEKVLDTMLKVFHAYVEADLAEAAANN